MANYPQLLSWAKLVAVSFKMGIHLADWSLEGPLLGVVRPCEFMLDFLPIVQSGSPRHAERSPMAPCTIPAAPSNGSGKGLICKEMSS